MAKGNDVHLRTWREFRESLTDLSDIEKLEAINKFWMLHPFIARSIDPDDPSLWLTAWDMVYYDQVCEYSRAILIHQTALMVLSNISESYMIYVIDPTHHQDRMLTVINGKVLNYDFALMDYQEISDVIQIQNKFESDKKGVYSIF